MKSGRLLVAGLLALGCLAGAFAAWYWTRPRNAARGAFTQLHTALIQGKRDRAARLVADRVTGPEGTRSRAEFLASYAMPRVAGTLEVVPCASVPEHWSIRMNERSWCFLEESSRWKLHWLGPSACACSR